MDMGKTIFSSSTYVGVAIAHANFDKVVDVEKKMKEYESKITLLENQDKDYKYRKYKISNFIGVKIIEQCIERIL